MMKAEIKQQNGLPVLYVNGERKVPYLFFSNTELRSKHEVCRRQIKMAGDHGIHLHSVCCMVPTYAKRGRRDFSQAIRSLELAVENDPEAAVLLRLNVSIYGQQAVEWEREHPGDSMRFAVDNPDASTMEEDTDDAEWATVGTAVTIASDAWLDAAADTLAELHELIEARPDLNSHLMGYHIAGAESGEWFHCSLRERGVDLSPTNRRKYQEWLREKYGDIAALAKSWELSDSVYRTFEDIPVPSDIPGNDRSRKAERMLFTQPGDQKYRDYSDYSSDIVADRIRRLAAAGRAVTKGEKLIVFFYGYYFDLYDARAGHFRLNSVLDDPNIDAFSSPVCYTDRNHGGVGALMSPADSILLHGKGWFVENDLRTIVVLQQDEHADWVPPIDSIDHVLEVYRRESGQMMIHGLYCWYMDLISRGWQYHPDIWREAAALRDLYEDRMDVMAPLAPDVAVVVDERAMSWVAHAQDCGMPLLYRMRLHFYRAGVSFGFYTVEDVLSGKVPSAKLVWYLNPFGMDEEKAARLDEVLTRQRTSAVYQYGFADTDPAVVRALTGMEIGVFDERMTELSMKPGDWMNGPEFMPPMKARPASYVEPSPGVVPLAVYTGGALRGRLGAAASERDGLKSVFVGAMDLTPAAVREICRFCGVHVYCDSEDTLMAGNGLIVLHSTEKPGVRTVYLPRTAVCRDLLTGETLPASDRLEADMKDCETRIWALE